ncbi:MAG: hypothetical protein WKF58_01415 [Ilumatobacteraceae bacterium]
MVGHVPAAAGELLAMGERQHELGLMAPHGGGDVASQRHPILDRPVRVVEVFEHVDTDRVARGTLLCLAHDGGLVRVHRVDAGLSTRHEQVGDRLAGIRPRRDRCGGAVLDVIGMSDDGERRRPVVWQREQIGGAAETGSPLTSRRPCA